MFPDESKPASTGPTTYALTRIVKWKGFYEVTLEEQHRQSRDYFAASFA